MLKASALVYALVMALISSVVSGALVLYAYMIALSLETAHEHERILNNVNSGITLLLSTQDLVPDNSEKCIDLFGRGSDSVELKRAGWGVLAVVSARAKWKNYTQERLALCGTPLPPEKNTCFYLCETDRPLAVCGKTLLTGNCYLPKEGIKFSYIEGENFTGDRPVHGQTFPSTRELPDFNKEPFKDLMREMEDPYRENDSVIDLGNSPLPDTLTNSFMKRRLLVRSAFPVQFLHQFLKGNIYLYSSVSVTIGEDAAFDNIVVIAPRIIIREKAQGNGQFFASDSLLVEKEVKLGFPSAVGLLRRVSSSQTVSATIREKAEISGDVFCYSENNDLREQDLLSIENGVCIRGQVFCTGELGLQGTVYGAVIGRRLMLRTSSAMYENQLLDAVVDRSKLPGYYAGMDLWQDDRPKKVIAWVH
jgi:hypothetical protein